MKKCPYCKEEIQTDAIKCRYCGEFLRKEQKTVWFFKTSTLIITFLCIGPFALPLLWFNPRFQRINKIIITVVVLIISYYLGKMLNESLRSIASYYENVFSF